MRNSALAQSIAAMVVILAPMTAWEAYLGHFRSGFPLKAQSALLHYRGAFNNPLMYIPVTLPLAAAGALAWQGLEPSVFGAQLAVAGLWLTFLSGLVGLGMHIQGIDRQMGGFYLGLANLMQGPPLTAPLVFSGFAATALVTLRLT